MTGKEAPPGEKVVPKANALANRDKLREFVNSPEAKKQVDGYVELFGKLQAQSKGKNFGLPVQILGDKIVTGEVERDRRRLQGVGRESGGEAEVIFGAIRPYFEPLALDLLRA